MKPRSVRLAPAADHARKKRETAAQRLRPGATGHARASIGT